MVVVCSVIVIPLESVWFFIYIDFTLLFRSYHHFLKHERKSESGANSKRRDDTDLASELFGDLFTDEQPETYSMRVHLPCVLHGSEHLEQALLVWLRHAHSSVFHWNHNLWLFFWTEFVCNHVQISHCLIQVDTKTSLALGRHENDCDRHFSSCLRKFERVAL